MRDVLVRRYSDFISGEIENFVMISRFGPRNWNKAHIFKWRHDNYSSLYDVEIDDPEKHIRQHFGELPLVQMRLGNAAKSVPKACDISRLGLYATSTSYPF